MNTNDGKPRRTKSQKIVIPKGSINPNEETVIEIPPHMRKKAVVVAKKDASSVGVLKRRQTDKSTVVFRDQSTLTGHSREQRQKERNSHKSYDPSTSNSHYQTAGQSHASYADFADEHDIQRLLDDLEKYYCTQRQLLLRAKISRLSTCRADKGSSLCQERNEDECRTKNRHPYYDPDSCAYDRFKSGINPDKASDKLHQIYNLPKSVVIGQGTKSAPQSQTLLGIDSSSSFRKPFETKSASYGRETCIRPQYIPSTSSMAGKDRNYGKLLNSKKVFAYHAEELRKHLNTLKPSSFESKKQFKKIAESLRQKLKELYNIENNILE